MALNGGRRTRGPGRLRLQRRAQLTGLLNAGTSWLLFAGLVFGFGAVWGRFRISAAVPGSEGAAVTLGRVAGICLTIALVLVFVRQMAEFRDPFATLQEDIDLLLSTDWGRTWKWGMVAAVVTGIAFFFSSASSSLSWIVAALGVIGLGVFPALTGHAASGEPRWLSVSADALHVWAAASWIGGLTFVLLGDRQIRYAGGRSQLSLLVPAFSGVAMVSVAVLITSGLYASVIHLDQVASLWTTPYGRLLSAKIGLALGVFALGGLNWRRWSPRLGDSAADEALRSSAKAEILLAHGVLILTALLIRTSPG